MKKQTDPLFAEFGLSPVRPLPESDRGCGCLLLVIVLLGVGVLALVGMALMHLAIL